MKLLYYTIGFVLLLLTTKLYAQEESTIEKVMTIADVDQENTSWNSNPLYWIVSSLALLVIIILLARKPKSTAQ